MMQDTCPKTGQNLKPNIKTKELTSFNKWVAFVTFEGYDFSESGSTEAEAIETLVIKHPQLQKLLPS